GRTGAPRDFRRLRRPCLGRLDWSVRRFRRLARLRTELRVRVDGGTPQEQNLQAQEKHQTPSPNKAAERGFGIWCLELFPLGALNENRVTRCQLVVRGRGG